MFIAAALVLTLLTTSFARPYDEREDAVRVAPARRWYQPSYHSVHRLFRRSNSPVTPGSPQWFAQYPPDLLAPITEAMTPPEWLAALTVAEQAGKIPNISVSMYQNGATPAYPAGNPAGPEICSSSSQCRDPKDIWDAPPGHMAIGFDDGPTYGSEMLYQFLREQNQSATHFMIGVNIRNNLDLFHEAYSTLQDDIAVHTWTHPYMTTQNNTQIVAQIGWTMQIIYDLTGGRVPRYWRPPFGDSDNRVRAIVSEVFNLTQVDWNHDSGDWNLNTHTTTLQKVEASMNAIITGPKSPGLIVLEHELTDNTSGVFIAMYPEIKSNGWITTSMARLFDGAWRNADDNDGPVQSLAFAADAALSTSSPTATSIITNITITTTGTTNPKSSQASPSGANGNNAKTNTGWRSMPSPLLSLVSLVLILL